MIDKHTPLKFVADKDQRLVGDGEMIVAQNVTITERGTGSGSILKTSKGFSGIVKDTGVDDLESEVVVIGQVTDEQRGFVYFFATHNSDSNHTEDMIVQYSHSSGKYKIVFKNTWLNFEKTYFVKANVVSKAFQQDGALQSVIYFTDNVNPPRKINVDRALAGDFDGYSSTQLDHALSVIKGAPITAPSFDFQTNTNYSINNFERVTMQFSIQYIYDDGEISAIGPYSKLAFPDHIAASGLEGDESGQLYFTDNECVIDTNWRLDAEDIENYVKDVSKIRLLGTKDNGVTAFIIDEFNPNENLVRQVMGSSTTVYTANSGLYRFLNEGVYQPLSSAELTKLYDNVPLKAEGQAVVENRLMYSNYEEGRPNTETRVSLTTRYSDEVSGGSVLIALDDSDLISQNLTARSGDSQNFYWEWEFLDTDAFSADTDTVPGGTLFSTSVELEPRAAVRKVGATGYVAGAYILTGSMTHDGYTYNIGIGRSNDTSNNSALDVPLPVTGEPPVFSTSLSSPEDQTLSSFTNLFLEEVEEFFNGYTIERTFQYNAGNTKAEVYYAPPTATAFSQGDNVNLNGGTYTIQWKFDVTHPTTTSVRVRPYIGNVTQNNLSVGGSQDGETYTGNFGLDSDTLTLSTQLLNDAVTGGLRVIGDESKSMRTFASKSTFKAGCSHDLGIVYYDEFNRSGFVNRLGSFYVKHPAERNAGDRGAASVYINWDTNYDAPDWAKRYQIVYGGMSSYESFTQYTTGRAFVPRKANYTVNNTRKQIYVKLDTLVNYRNEKSAVIDYSFTEGDKLRIVKWSSTGGSSPSDFTYPLANDNKTLVEFNVVGVTELGDANNPIAPSGTPGVQHKGRFIILEAPQVAAGIQSQSASVQELKYLGFDWFSVARAADNTIVYPDGSTPSAPNWGKLTMVEILTPKRTEDKVWYEIGESHKVGTRRNAVYDTLHGPNITVDQGDCYLRTTAANTPVYDSGWSLDANPDDYEYKNVEIESQYVSDFFQSNRWSRGRSHTTFEGAATVNRYNGITYSDPYADDTAVLRLSSFNPVTINFFDLPSENGRCAYIEKLNDKLVAIQENKVSLVGVNKGVIQTGTQSGLVALSTEVLQNIIPYAGDHGTQNPESVLIRNGVVYFADSQRYAIVRLSERSYDVISDIDIKSEIEDAFDLWIPNDNGKHRIVCGYDPSDDIFYFTLLTQTNPTTFSRTYGFDEKGKFWQGKYTFFPDVYAAIKDYMLICDHDPQTDASDLFIFKMSEDANSNAFPPNIASPNQSRVTVVSNVDPSAVKAYESISLEADNEWFVSLKTSSGQETGNLSFSEREDAFYAFVTGDITAKSRGQYIPVGKIASIDGSVLTMENSLRGIHIPKGYRVAKALPDADQFLPYTQTVTSVDRPNKQITISSTNLLSAGDALFVFADKSINGDQIRGHYCEINCIKTPSGTAREELYAINAKFVESKANHRKG
jgi:hypothetical protein